MLRLGRQAFAGVASLGSLVFIWKGNNQGGMAGQGAKNKTNNT